MKSRPLVALVALAALPHCHREDPASQAASTPPPVVAPSPYGSATAMAAVPAAPPAAPVAAQPEGPLDYPPGVPVVPGYVDSHSMGGAGSSLRYPLEAAMVRASFEQTLTGAGWARYQQRRGTGPGGDISYYCKGAQSVTVQPGFPGARVLVSTRYSLPLPPTGCPAT